MVLIILLLLSPLAVFILHKKHRMCSMRRNSVISSSLETSRSGHAKEINKNNRTGIQSHPSYWPPAQLHTSHHTEANPAVHDRGGEGQQQVTSSCQQMHHSIFYVWQNKKLKKRINSIGHVGRPLGSTWIRRTFFRSTVYRQKVRTNR